MGAEGAADPAGSAAILEVVDTFREELGGEPTLGEFLEILRQGFPENLASLAGTVGGFRVKLSGGRGYRAAGKSKVGELNDAAFNDAAEVWVELAQAGTGGKPGVVLTPKDVMGALAAAIRGSGVVFADVPASEVESVAVVVSRKKSVVVRPGDVVAIPAGDGGYHLAVFIIRNQIGAGLGLFERTVATPGIPDLGAHPPRLYTVYTDEISLRAGVWPVVGHDESLLALFPAEPEIYHKLRPGRSEDEYGKYGLAEIPTPSELRKVGREEAAEVGLLDDSYRQTRGSAQLSTFLDNLP